jgi:hypothetical protein
MPNLLSLIKRAAVEAVAEAQPCAVLYGTVEAADPLMVKVDGNLTLNGTRLTRTHAGAGLERGQTAVLLRVQGGDRYVVLGGMV